MEIQWKYFQKYLHEAAVEQLRDEYVSKGYRTVNTKNLMHSPDLLVEKDEQRMFIEVKSGAWSKKKEKAVEKLMEQVNAMPNARFLLAFATLPKQIEVEVIGIENVLVAYLLREMPSELAELATQVFIDNVFDVNLEQLSLDGGRIKAKGAAIAAVNLQYGSDSDQRNDNGYKTSEKIPFDFSVLLTTDANGKLQVDELEYYEFHTQFLFE